MGNCLRAFALVLFFLVTSAGANAQTIPVVSTLPGLCRPGAVAMLQSDLNVYYCASPNIWVLLGPGGAGGGAGDVSSNTASSTDGQLFVASGTGGKTLKLFTQSGVLKSTAGVVSPVSGTSTDCVKVDGTSGACGAGTTYTAGPTGALSITGGQIDIVSAYVPGLTTSNTWTGVNDFSGATSTIPQKMGTSFPATCVKGERYWHNTLDVEATCVATNVWSYTGGMPGKFSRIYDEMCGSDNYPDASIMGERWYKIGTIADLSSSLSDANHTCTFNMNNVGANAASGIALRYNSTNNDSRFGTLGGLNTTLGEFHFVFQPNDITQVLYRVGLASSLEQALPTNGIYAQFASNTGCTITGSDAGWQYTTRAAGVSSTASGPALTAGTWIHLRIRSVTAGTWLFSVSVNGGAFSTEQSLSTNVPSANLAPVFLVVPCEAVYKYLTADLYHGFVATQR